MLTCFHVFLPIIEDVVPVDSIRAGCCLVSQLRQDEFWRFELIWFSDNTHMHVTVTAQQPAHTFTRAWGQNNKHVKKINIWETINKWATQKQLSYKDKEAQQMQQLMIIPFTCFLNKDNGFLSLIVCNFLIFKSSLLNQGVEVWHKAYFAINSLLKLYSAAYFFGYRPLWDVTSQSLNPWFPILRSVLCPFHREMALWHWVKLILHTVGRLLWFRSV